MANTIKIKRSSVSGKVPTTSQLELGELAVNTYDGKLYTKKDDGTAAVVEIGGVSATADSLTTARDIALSGDVSGSASFDGSANVTITATVADDSHNHVISNVDGLQTALDAKAPLASPALTGTPTAPTAAAGTNTTQVATTAFVSTAVANVIDSAPAALDTLNELAAALGDDANFSTTVTNSIATKLPLSGGQMTGNITFSGSQTVDGRDLSVDGAKLDGIAAGAQVNVATNLAQGTRTTTTVPVTSSTGTDATLTAATTSLAGVMTSADKSKLDGIAAGAQVNVATNLGVTTTTTSNTITSSTGTNATIGEATSSAAGLMSTTHHDKLDGIAAGATNVTNNNQLTNGAGYITSSGSISGNAATATTLQTARTINGVSFNGSGNITVEAYIENDDSTNATRYLTFVDDTTASFKRLNEDSSLTYNPFSNVLSAGTFSGSGASLSSLNASNLSSGTVPSGRLSGSYGISVTGSSASCTGNASTASTLATSRTIALGGDLSGSASFNGGANITITAAVADDSHNHVISNVDGLQTALDAKASTTSPTFSGDVTMSGTGALKVANGTTAQRPTGANGMVRYNTTLGALESYVQGAWQVIANTALDYGLITSASTTTFDYGALS